MVQAYIQPTLFKRMDLYFFQNLWLRIAQLYSTPRCYTIQISATDSRLSGWVYKFSNAVTI